MKEIEVKILDVDVKEIMVKLERLGARKVSEGKQEAILFDYKNGRLRKDKKLLRLRTDRGKVQLTFKESISHKKAKINVEHEVHIDNFKDILKILKGIGLNEVVKYSKYRITYKLKDVTCELDKYPGVPVFLEIEAPTLKKLKETVIKLGFKMKDTKPWSGKKVKEFYKK